MNQTPAAILVLAASGMAYAAHAASLTAHNQSSVILTLAALATGLWGAISLVTATIRERELLVDSHARLETLDRVMVRDPLRTIAQFARPHRGGSAPRPLAISPELHAQLAAIAQLEGRDQSEILEEALRQHLPKFKTVRAA